MKKKREHSMLLPWQLHLSELSQYSSTDMRPPSLILPLLALLRLKLTSDENKEKEKEAGGTKDKAVLVREE